MRWDALISFLRKAEIRKHGGGAGKNKKRRNPVLGILEI